MSDLFGDVPRKRCLECRQMFPESEFWSNRCRKNGRTYLQSRCKPCALKQRMRAHHAPAGQHRHWVAGLKKYGITLAGYQALIEKQGGVCAICRKTETRRNRRGEIRRLSVDHDHATGMARGLLCSSCNNGIGYFGDDPNLLKSALDYLQKHSV